MHASNQVSALVTAAFLLTNSMALAADGGDWIVTKSSGEIWLSGSEVQQASLKQDDLLKPGDTIRTGRTGRVLLKRGEESILIAPNSVVGIPAEKKEGLSTTIVQQAGSILLDVEKRNVKHFEVETPYMAAVVKGTQFRVTVHAGKTSVDVVRGQVDVSDFKSGQIARVMAGQHATAFAHGKNGLSLGGTGTLNPIEQGTPRTPSIQRVPVPSGGLTMPRNATNGRSAQAIVQTSGGVTRISSAIGEARLNVHRATHGFARDKSATHGGGRNSTNKDTIWNSSANGSPVANSNQGNGNATGANSVSSTIARVSGADGGVSGKSNNGKGKGDGNGSGNGHGNGNGKGNGNANGNGNGNGGNGANGNGRGNGHANGHGKK
jgi:hypothetical protein